MKSIALIIALCALCHSGFGQSLMPPAPVKVPAILQKHYGQTNNTPFTWQQESCKVALDFKNWVLTNDNYQADANGFITARHSGRISLVYYDRMAFITVDCVTNETYQLWEKCDLSSTNCFEVAHWAYFGSPIYPCMDASGRTMNFFFVKQNPSPVPPSVFAIAARDGSSDAQNWCRTNGVPY